MSEVFFKENKLNMNNKSKFGWIKENAVEILAGILVCIGILVAINAHRPINYTGHGQLGDYFGGVAGSLWALAGVFLFYSALMKQKKALDQQSVIIEDQKEMLRIQNNTFEMQSEELELQRQEVIRTRNVLERQSKNQQQMQFEQTFFQILFRLEAKLSQISIKLPRNPGGVADEILFTGENAINEIFERFFAWIDANSDSKSDCSEL